MFLQIHFVSKQSIAAARMNDLKIPNFPISRFMSKWPYRSGHQIIFNKDEPLSDWTPPLRTPCLPTDRSKIRIPGQNINNNHKLIRMDMIGVEVNSEQQLFTYYLKTCAKALGSEEEAKKRIYLASTGRSFGFGVEVDDKSMSKLGLDDSIISVCSDSGYFQRKKFPPVQSVARFTPMNLNHRLDSIFSYHHLSEPNPKWKSDHWLIILKQPRLGFTDTSEVTKSCIKMLAAVVGSEEEAMKNIYIIWFKFPYGFAAKIEQGALDELRGFSDVEKVIPDFAFDIKEKKREYQEALRILPSSEGLRFSCCRLNKEYGSEDWLISMEEYFGVPTDSDCSFLRYYLDINDPHLTDFDERSACKHWFVIMEKPCGENSPFQRRIDDCIRILNTALRWSVKKKIYRIKCVNEYIGFGINIAERTSNKLRGIQGVRGVLPDYSINKSHKVRSVHQLTPYTPSQLLGDIFTYHHLSECHSEEGICDHWLINIKAPIDGFSTESQTINFCIQMLAEIVGSEEQAKKMIYIVWCKIPFGFGARIDENMLNLLKGLPDVIKVLPDRAVLPDHASALTNKNRGALVISAASSSPEDTRSIFYNRMVGEHYE